MRGVLHISSGEGPSLLDAILTAEMRWVSGSALCAQTDPDLFFPLYGDNSRRGREVCVACPLIEPCLQYAMERPWLEGTWGGASHKQRQQMRKQAS